MKKTNRIIGKALGRLALILALLAVISSSALGVFAADDHEVSRTSGKYEDIELLVGGEAFGVKFSTKGVMVVGMSEIKCAGKPHRPARDAGLQVRDVIISANGKDVDRVTDVSGIIEQSGGKEIKMTVKRDNGELEITLIPIKDDADGKYKGGLMLRDSTAGIGTVTYIDPKTGEFGGLGHGICDIDTGELLPLKKGTAMKVMIGGVVKGKVGKPGEIKGYFLPEKSGSVIGNTLCGVFGVFSDVSAFKGQKMKIGTRNEIKDGKATAICTLGDDGPQKYEIEISRINRGGNDNKNFVVKVTDPKLIERTGGIVQGMSGSPIIQNGRLVGAITHVMVNDPEVGYGILIENMLDSMSSLS